MGACVGSLVPSFTVRTARSTCGSCLADLACDPKV